jgi:hypothetical protein
MTTDGEPGQVRTRWLIVNEVISGPIPSAIFSILEEPFPSAMISLEGVTFEYGDDRGFEDAPQKDSQDLRDKWVCFLVLALPAGRLLLFSEVRRDFKINL